MMVVVWLNLPSVIRMRPQQGVGVRYLDIEVFFPSFSGLCQWGFGRGWVEIAEGYQNEAPAGVRGGLFGYLGVFSKLFRSLPMGVREGGVKLPGRGIGVSNFVRSGIS